MANNNPSQSTLKAAQALVREEDLADLENLLRDLQGRVDQAHADGRVYIMSVLVRLVAMVSPEIDRVQRRFKRESLASMRKEHKALKLAHKASQNGNSEEA